MGRNRSTSRSALVALVAAFAMSAVATASASAHEFIVEGKAVAAGEQVAAEGTGGVVKVEKQESNKTVTIECKSSRSKNHLEKEGKSYGGVTFEKCAIVGLSGCQVPNWELKYSEQLVLFEALLADEFKSEAGQEKLGDLEIETCALKGTYAVTGVLTCSLPGIGVEGVEHEVACEPKGSSLKIGGASASITSSEKVRLESGKRWSAK